MYDKNNVFFKILQSEIQCKRIFENDVAISFFDINPACKVHALVITKGLYRNFAEFISSAPEIEIKKFSKAVVKTAELLELAEGGYRLVTNTGKDSGQEVEHFHVHILGGEKLSSIC